MFVHAMQGKSECLALAAIQVFLRSTVALFTTFLPCVPCFQERIARFMGRQEAIIYAYDMATVPSVIPAFANAKDLIICDEVSPDYVPALLFFALLLIQILIGYQCCFKIVP